jgi:hypothetical protein
LKPRQVLDQEDYRPGTKKGKLDRHPIWIVEVRMPKKLLADLYSAELDNLDVKEIEQGTAPVEQAVQPPVEGGAEV